MVILQSQSSVCRHITIKWISEHSTLKTRGARSFSANIFSDALFSAFSTTTRGDGLKYSNRAMGLRNDLHSFMKLISLETHKNQFGVILIIIACTNSTDKKWFSGWNNWGFTVKDIVTDFVLGRYQKVELSFLKKISYLGLMFWVSQRHTALCWCPRFDLWRNSVTLEAEKINSGVKFNEGHWLKVMMGCWLFLIICSIEFILDGFCTAKATHLYRYYILWILSLHIRSQLAFLITNRHYSLNGGSQHPCL